MNLKHWLQTRLSTWKKRLARLRFKFGIFLALHVPAPRKSGQNRWVIYKPDALGDFVLATSAISEFLRLVDCRAVLITSTTVFPFAKGQFPQVEVVALDAATSISPGGWLRSLKSGWLLASRYAGCNLISLRHGLSDVDNIVLQWLQPRESHGIPSPLIAPPRISRRCPFTFSFALDYPLLDSHLPGEILAHREVVNSAARMRIPGANFFPKLPRLPQNFKKTDYLLVFPVTRSSLRNYPLHLLAESISTVSRQDGIRIRLCGNEAEKEHLLELKNMLAPEIDADIQRPSSVDDLCRLILESRCVLSMESAPAHLAICMGVPGVFILGGGHYGHFAPWGDEKTHIWIAHPLPCFNCNWQCRFPEPQCITRIQPLAISKALLELLALKG